jgi:hypothetical protein
MEVVDNGFHQVSLLQVTATQGSAGHCQGYTFEFGELIYNSRFEFLDIDIAVVFKLRAEIQVRMRIRFEKFA